MLLAPALVWADGTRCLAAFADVAATDDQAPVLVWATYRELLEKVGGAALTLGHLEQLLAAEDPFLLRESEGVETLAKKLEQFKKLVEVRGWNTAPVRESLKKKLSAWIRERSESIERRRRHIENAQEDVRLPYDAHRVLSATPDGRWVVALTPPNKISVYDASYKTLKEYPFPEELFGVTLTPDGTALTIITKFRQMVRVPLQEGIPNLSAANTSGSFLTNHAPEQIARHGQKRVYIGGRERAYPTHYFEDGKRIDVVMGFYREAGAASGWGVVPGTDDLYFVAKAPGGYEIHEVPLDKEGFATLPGGPRPGPRRRWETDDEVFAHWSEDGNRILAFTADKVAVFDKGALVPKTVFAKNMPGLPESNLMGVSLHRNGREAAVLMSPVVVNGRRTPDTAERIVWLDLETKRAVGIFTFSDTREHSLHQVLGSDRVVVQVPALDETRLVDVKGRLELLP